MTRVGLLGWPVAHSVSPAMHNAAFAALGIADWQYDPLPVEPENLARRASELIEAGYAGFNVTVPHKKAVLKLAELRQMSDSVKAIGAANTLIVKDGGLYAENTDWRGFTDDLANYGIAVRDRHCAILGTGGSAKAVAYALAKGQASSMTFVSRIPSQREDVIGYDELSALPENSLIVNCTPVGMHPHIEDSPWPDDIDFPAGAVVYDLIYNPPQTRLMKQAKAAESPAYNGLGMLVKQAELSFELWTGQRAPDGVMAGAARKALNLTEPSAAD